MKEKEKHESEPLEHAFPLVGPQTIFSRGMTLRDYFAAHALSVANKIAYMEVDTDKPDDPMKRVVREAYSIADEMIKQREQ